MHWLRVKLHSKTPDTSASAASYWENFMQRSRLKSTNSSRGLVPSMLRPLNFDPTQHSIHLTRPGGKRLAVTNECLRAFETAKDGVHFVSSLVLSRQASPDSEASASAMLVGASLIKIPLNPP